MYQHKQPVLICSAKRTPIGSMGGALSTLETTQLGSIALQAVLKDSGVPPETIDEVIMGCVLQGGTGQAPARQAALGAGLPNTVQAAAVNKVCSSGLKAIMLAANSIELGQAQAIIAGGMESMSRAPYLLPKLRDGARLGDTQALDSILRDGLIDPYDHVHMGICAELCAREKSISREAQDAFALQSYSRASAAIADGAFKAEIAPVTVAGKRDSVTVEDDEEPGRLKAEKVPELRPVFERDGSVTAANASSLNDGAAAVLVCTETYAKSHGLAPLARIVAQAWNAQEPKWFTTAPIGAVERVLQAAGKKIDDIDLFEINEAFSVVALAIQSTLKIPGEKLNIRGGAVALGHPIGCTGARLVTTLAHALKQTGAKSGIASLCNGGGEATAVMIEALA